MAKSSLKKARITLLLTVIFIAIASIVLSAIPFTSGITEGEDNTLSYIIATVFWIGIVCALISAFFTKIYLKGYLERLISEGILKEGLLPGIISFSMDKKMIPLYAVTALGFVLIITDIAFNYIPSTLMFGIISITILSFALHCVVDGKYYKVYKLIKESTDNETNHKF